MSQHFNIRRSVDFTTSHSVLNLKTLHEENPYLRVAYCVGRKPEDYIPGFLDSSAEPKAIIAFNNLLSKHGFSDVNKETIPQIAQAARDDLFAAVLTDDFVHQIGQDIIKQIQAAQKHGRDIDQIRIIAPFPINPNETKNQLTPALAATLTHKLEKSMPALLESAGIAPNIQVLAELDRRMVESKDTILNISKNGRSNIDVRGSSENQTEREMLDYASNLAQQPLYAGPVHRNAVYVPVDDNLFGQTTLAALTSYVQSSGGHTTGAVTVARWVKGIEELELQQETLNLFNQAMEDLPTQQKQKTGGVAGAKKTLQELYATVGLSLDFDDLDKNTLSNIEMLFIASVFANGKNPKHTELYNKALNAVGSTPEVFTDTIPDFAMKAPPPDIHKLQHAFKQKLELRSMLIAEKNPRFVALHTQNSISSYDF